MLTLFLPYFLGFDYTFAISTEQPTQVNVLQAVKKLGTANAICTPSETLQAQCPSGLVTCYTGEKDRYRCDCPQGFYRDGSKCVIAAKTYTFSATLNDLKFTEDLTDQTSDAASKLRGSIVNGLDRGLSPASGYIDSSVVSFSESKSKTTSSLISVQGNSTLSLAEAKVAIGGYLMQCTKDGDCFGGVSKNVTQGGVEAVLSCASICGDLCAVSSDGVYKCGCPQNFKEGSNTFVSGLRIQNCTLFDPCETAVCTAAGTCIPVDAYRYSCNCEKDFVFDGKQCTSCPCVKDRGNCTISKLNDGHVYCNCDWKYNGEFCEKILPLQLLIGLAVAFATMICMMCCLGISCIQSSIQKSAAKNAKKKRAKGQKKAAKDPQRPKSQALQQRDPPKTSPIAQKHGDRLGDGYYL